MPGELFSIMFLEKILTKNLCLISMQGGERRRTAPTRGGGRRASARTWRNRRTLAGKFLPFFFVKKIINKVYFSNFNAGGWQGGQQRGDGGQQGGMDRARTTGRMRGR